MFVSDLALPMIKKLSIPLLILMIGCLSCGGPEDRQIRIENGEWIKSFVCDPIHPGSIRPEYYRNKDGLTRNHSGIPYFAFILNASDRATTCFFLIYGPCPFPQAGKRPEKHHTNDIDTIIYNDT
jgi:hypothetical protein